MLLMMIFPFAAYPMVTVITIVNTVGLITVLVFVPMCRRRASPAGVQATHESVTSTEGGA
jgi:hypothetical protein